MEPEYLVPVSSAQPTPVRRTGLNVGDTLPRAYHQGTYRGRAPEDTFRLIQPYLREAGITRIAVVTGLDVIGMPVVMVTRPGGRSLSVAQGKGTTLVSAKVSGMMEGLEHHCAETIDLPLFYASMSEMNARGHRVIDVAGLPQTVSPLHADAPILWVAGASLVSGESRWIPYEVVHLDFRLPLPAGSGHFLASSNGLASGNCLAEAMCHALSEVIERCETVAFYELSPADQERRRVDTTTIDHVLCRSLLELLRKAKVGVAIWDLSSERDVACFMCDLVDEEQIPFRTLARARGVGCHADHGIALLRALCEAAQCRLTLIVGSRDDISRKELDDALSPEAWDRARRQIIGCNGSRDFSAAPHRELDSFECESEWLVSRLRETGYSEIAVVDLSKPAWPVAVVRVVVPGLRSQHGLGHHARVDAR